MNDERENAQRLLESYAILQRQNQDKTVEIERLKDEVQRRKLVNRKTRVFKFNDFQWIHFRFPFRKGE